LYLIFATHFSTMEIVFLIIGLAAGILIGWLLVRLKQSPDTSNSGIIDLTRELATQTEINKER